MLATGVLSVDSSSYACIASVVFWFVWPQGLDDTRVNTLKWQVTDIPRLAGTLRWSLMPVNGRLRLLAAVAPLVLLVSASNQRLGGAGQGSPGQSLSRHARRHAPKQVWLSPTPHISYIQGFLRKCVHLKNSCRVISRPWEVSYFCFSNVQHNGNPFSISHLLIWIICMSTSLIKLKIVRLT